MILRRRLGTRPAALQGPERPEAPSERANRFLFEKMDEGQKATWPRGFIVVRGSRGSRFCVHRGVRETVIYELASPGVHSGFFCSHIINPVTGMRGPYPEADVVIAYMAMLTNDEGKYRRIAPMSPLPLDYGAIHHRELVEIFEINQQASILRKWQDGHFGNGRHVAMDVRRLTEAQVRQQAALERVAQHRRGPNRRINP